MSTKLLTSSWGRSAGAMFQRHLPQPLIFAYPFAAPRLFHTLFCPPLRIAAYDAPSGCDAPARYVAPAGIDANLVKIFDRLVPPWRFVRIPKSVFVVEVNPGDVLPVDAVVSLYAAPTRCETGQMPAPDGGWEASVSLNSLLFALFAQAVADMRRVHEAHQKRCVVESDAMREQFPVWMRGRIAGSAGFLMDFAGVYDIPRSAFSLARQVMQAENPFMDEILAAGIAGVPWQKDFANECLRCGKPASWRTAVSAPNGMPAEVAWRYRRPENAVPLCHKCAARLDWNQSEAMRLDAAWGLWGKRFEALWQWHLAWQKNKLPTWDRCEHPLWPLEYGGASWADGSGAVRDADPRTPKGVRRLKRHQDALARVLSAGPALRNEGTLKKHPQAVRGTLTTSITLNSAE